MLRTAAEFHGIGPLRPPFMMGNEAIGPELVNTAIDWVWRIGEVIKLTATERSKGKKTDSHGSAQTRTYTV